MVSTRDPAVYIIGPQTTEEQRERFQEMADLLRFRGYRVINPLLIANHERPVEYMTAAVMQLVNYADAAIFLPDWEGFKVSRAEKYIAEFMGLSTYRYVKDLVREVPRYI